MQRIRRPNTRCRVRLAEIKEVSVGIIASAWFSLAWLREGLRSGLASAGF